VRSLRRYLYGVLLLWPLLVRANDPHGIELRLRSGSYFPGDVLQIEAEMQRPDYASFELLMPSHPQLYFVAHTREPLHYAQGVYRQRALLLLQPLVAGDYRLDGLRASIFTGAEHIEISLPSLQFHVDSYAASDDSSALLPLPSEVFGASEPSRLVELWGLCVAGIGLLCYLLQRRQRRETDPQQPVSACLDDLSLALQRGEVPLALMEQLLCGADLQLSARLRGALQAAVYGQHCDPAQLLRLIREEVAQ
jgi:hypothetical protein